MHSIRWAVGLCLFFCLGSKSLEKNLLGPQKKMRKESEKEWLDDFHIFLDCIKQPHKPLAVYQFLPSWHKRKLQRHANVCRKKRQRKKEKEQGIQSDLKKYFCSKITGTIIRTAQLYQYYNNIIIIFKNWLLK